MRRSKCCMQVNIHKTCVVHTEKYCGKLFNWIYNAIYTFTDPKTIRMLTKIYILFSENNFLGHHKYYSWLYCDAINPNQST